MGLAGLSGLSGLGGMVKANSSPFVAPSFTPPSGVTMYQYYGPLKLNGYSGNWGQMYKTVSGTPVTDVIPFNNNGLPSVSAVNTFKSNADNGFVGLTRVYSEVASGAVDAVQATASLMPYLVKAGVTQLDATGTILMPEYCFEGRYLAAVNAFPGSIDFSVSVLSQNKLPYLVSANAQANISPILGIGKSSNTQVFSAMWGATSATRYISAELKTSATGQFETSGSNQLYKANTIGIFTASCQAADVTLGPGAGTATYFNRGLLETINETNQVSTGLTTVSDIRFGARWVSGAWTTHSGTGADCGIAGGFVSSPMTDDQRNAAEGQWYDAIASVIAASLTVPQVNSSGEVFDFSKYANNVLQGINQAATLQFTTVAQGANWQVSKAPMGVNGLQSTGTTKFENNFRANSNFFWNQQTFTVAVLVTPNDITGVLIWDFISLATGALGTGNPTYDPMLVLGRDHQEFCAWTQDIITQWELFDKGVMVGHDMIVVKRPPKDQYSPAGDHVYDYNQKSHCLPGQTTDKGLCPYRARVPYLMILKHKPHPNFANNPNQLKYQATVEVKIAQVGQLNGFNSLPGSWVKKIGNASMAQGTSNMSICSDGGHQLNTFDGWRHWAAFFAKYTTDAEDDAIFYNALKPDLFVPPKVPSAPVNVIPPSLTGSKNVNERLTVIPGTYNAYPPPTLTYQIRNDNDATVVGNLSYYDLQNTDLGDNMSVAEMASNGVGSPITTYSSPYGPIGAPVMYPTLDSRWRMDITSGLTVPDAKPANRTLTITGTPTLGGDYIAIPTGTNNNFGLANGIYGSMDAWSIFGWLKFNTVPLVPTDGLCIGLGSSGLNGNNSMFVQFGNGNAVNFSILNASSVVSSLTASPTYSTSTKQFVCFRYDPTGGTAGAGKMQFDFRLAGTGAFTHAEKLDAGVMRKNANFEMYQRRSTTTTTGIDANYYDLGLAQYVISDAEMALLYNAGSESNAY